MSNIEVLHTHLFHAHHHLSLTKMIINLKCSALRKLCVLQFQLVCNSIIKNLWNIYFVSFALKRKKEKISHKKILLCENDIANINMFSQLSVLQFLSREVKGKYELQFARAQQEIAYVPG